MTAVRTAMVVLALTAATQAAATQAAATRPAAAQGESRGSNSRQTADRSAERRDTDSATRETQAQRQTEAPRPAVQRQPEPQRQGQPARQREPERQADAQRQYGTSKHWADPGPAWTNPGPAWRNLDNRSAVSRPAPDAFRAKPNTYAPRDASPRRDGRRDDDRRHDGRRDDGRRRGGKGNGNHATYYGVPYVLPYGYSTYYPYPIDSAPAASPVAPPAAPYDEPQGFLRLRVVPRTADVYIDGSLAGTVDDFGGSGERMLRAGPHRVEILAPGFAPLTFDVRVPENDTVTFTRELDPASAEPPPPAVAPVEIPHKALYIVPRCYIGDRPPLLTDMPAGCSLDDVRVIP